MFSAISYSPFNWTFFSPSQAKVSIWDPYLTNLNSLTASLATHPYTLDQWLEGKKEIKDFIQKQEANLSALDGFLKAFTEWGVEQDPQKTMDFLTFVMSLELLKKVVAFKENQSEIPFTDVFEWAAEQAPLCPELEDSSMKFRVYSEWKRYRPIVLHFIPNLLNIFLGAFNFIDFHKHYTSFFDKYLAFEIILKFFFIPYGLVKLLEPILIKPAKVYLVAISIVVATGTLVSCYQRWFRPLPDEIVNCKNLTKQVEEGKIQPKVGQAKELEHLTAALNVKSNVLLIGKSGEGKTALLHHFIQKKHTEKGRQPIVFEVDCGLIVSSYTYGYSEVMNQIIEQTNGYNDEVIFFFDEFNQIAVNDKSFKDFKKRFLQDEPHSRVIAAITFKEFEEIKKLDFDFSFRRRVVPIVIESSDDETVCLILRDLINRLAKDIPVTDDAIEALVKISAEKDYLPEIGRPAKAIKILMDALGLCRAAYDPDRVPVKLSQATQERQGLVQKSIHHIKADSKTLKKIREINKKIKTLKSELEKNRNQIKKIKQFIAIQQKFNIDYYRLTHLFAQTIEKGNFARSNSTKEDSNGQIHSTISKKAIGQDVQMRYLWYSFYAIEVMNKALQKKIDTVKDIAPIQVDKKLIHKAYEEFKISENPLYNDMTKMKNTPTTQDDNRKVEEKKIIKEEEVDKKTLKTNGILDPKEDKK